MKINKDRNVWNNSSKLSCCYYTHTMPSTNNQRSSSVSTHNKFKATDMPEIRRIRSSLLKSFKLVTKSTRSDKITKAILPNMDWQKLGISAVKVDPSTQTAMDAMDSAITTFRNTMAERLEEILCSASTDVESKARDDASSPVLFQSAATMAQKYHDRENKARSRPRFVLAPMDPTPPAGKTLPKAQPIKTAKPAHLTKPSAAKPASKVRTPTATAAKSATKVRAATSTETGVRSSVTATIPKSKPHSKSKKQKPSSQPNRPSPERETNFFQSQWYTDTYGTGSWA